MKKKWLTIPLAVLCTLLCGIMSGCDHSKTSGDFVYLLEKDGLYLEGLSEQGKEKETIVVPKEIDGYEVWNYAHHFWFHGSGNFESDNLRRIYFIPNISVYGNLWLESAPLLEKIVFIGGLERFHMKEFNNNIGVKVCVTKKPKPDEPYISYSEELGRVCSTTSFNNFYLTNINFMWNYEGADNEGYYWGDYFEYGTKVTYLPENPEREGYIFGGWYREAEGTHIWNFDTDTLPEAKYNADGEALYQETRLYAKWYKV